MSLQKPRLKKLIMYPKDIERVMGRSYRSACMLWNEVHKSLNKSRHQVITVQEFCAYLGIEEELVAELLK